jgi:hypothetical protein
MDKEKLLGLYPGYTSVLGPYTRPDGRKHVILNNSNASNGTKGKTKTISYPKALMEVELNKKLNPDETVDHHDRDFTNDNSINLKVKTRSLHASEDALRIKVEDIRCPQCGKYFTPSVSQRNKVNSIIAGPFCSKQCSGLYGTNIQKGMQPY